MSEGVLLAIVSAAAGLIGAGIGSWTTLKSAKLNTDAQLKQSILHSLFLARFQAYGEVEKAYAEWYNGGACDQPLKDSFGDVCLKAILIAGNCAKPAIEALHDYILTTDEEFVKNADVVNIYTAALDAMNQDLQKIELPQI